MCRTPSTAKKTFKHCADQHPGVAYVPQDESRFVCVEVHVPREVFDTCLLNGTFRVRGESFLHFFDTAAAFDLRRLPFVVFDGSLSLALPEAQGDRSAENLKRAWHVRESYEKSETMTT